MIRCLLFLLLPLVAFPQEAPSYLEQLVRTAEQSLAKEVPDKAAWLANRDRYRRELKEMLGLDPEPPRGDLKPVITGTVEGDGFVVEKLHFQSLPGLYVTANYYRPATVSGKLPTILYVSGHGPTYAPDGTSCGNKASYQHHGIWFARHGYTCLILDTVQWGEILGEHHGTYRLNRWWWVSRGYTPAGVETWAGIRALDYLATRPEVDMEKIGVTGRSGGGAYSWFITAVDDRIAVSAPTAGITTLRDHVINGVIEGHCDCMYLVNVYGWDFDKLSALCAPRPLLISNTDKDNIFPLGGVIRIHENTRRIYEFLDAGKNLGLQIAEGPHKDMQPLNIGTFHWFERFLKGKDLMDTIAEPAVKAFKPEQLRVFSEIPKDEINTRIDETFVPMANLSVPQTREEWEGMRDGWMKVLRERVLSEKQEPTTASSAFWFRPAEYPMGFPTEIQLANAHFKPKSGTTLNVHFRKNLISSDGVFWDTIGFDSNSFLSDTSNLTFMPGALLEGITTIEKLEHHHWVRRFLLCGASFDALRCNEVSRLLKLLPPSALNASGDLGVAVLYSTLLSDKSSNLNLRNLHVSHLQGPHFPGILKYMDIPQAVTMAAEKMKVRITGRREDWTWAIQTAERMGFAQNLEIVPALEVVEVKKIWDAAPHNAFTSLTKYKDEWFVTFRESSGHVPGTDGAVRVLVSKDGSAWESAALLTETGVDLRDPKFCIAPDERLMLTIGGSIYEGASAPGANRKRTAARTRTAFSNDGRTWTAPQPACADGQWLWRVTQRPHAQPPFDPPGVPELLYGVAYTVADENKFKLSLWQSPDGAQFTRFTNLDPGRNVLPNETTIRFGDSGTMLALTRSENTGQRGHAMFGLSEPPYDKWSWTDTGHIVQGPDFIRLADGRMFYGGRDFVDGKANTTIGILTATGQAMPLLVLPSGGDCSYPGLAEGPDGQVWVSYYSSHEGKASIYLARLKLAR